MKVVGTSGLGYPLLLCLSKGLVVILDYVQTAGPLWTGVLFSRQRTRTYLTAGKGPGTPRVLEEAGTQPEQPGLWTSRGVRTPAEVPDPSWIPDPSLRVEVDALPRGGPEPTRVQGRLVSILSLTHHCIHCNWWTPALMPQKPRRFFDQGALLIAYYQDSGAAGAAHAAPAKSAITDGYDGSASPIMTPT